MSTTDLPDFLGGEAAPAPEAQAPAAEPAPQAALEAAADGQPRGEDGKFAAAPPAAEAPPVAQPEPHAVPISALLDEREKRQAAEREAKELREWRQQQETTRQRPAPDPTEDPAGFQAYQAERVDMMLFEQGREISRRFAVMQHGEETVNAAYEWGVKRCDDDPHFNAKVRGSQDPYGFVMSEYQRDQIAANVDPKDYPAYLAWKAAQTAAPGGQPQAHQAPNAPPAQPAAPRPSLAAAPSAGSHAAPEARDGEAQFNVMFR